MANVTVTGRRPGAGPGAHCQWHCECQWRWQWHRPGRDSAASESGWHCGTFWQAQAPTRTPSPSLNLNSLAGFLVKLAALATPSRTRTPCRSLPFVEFGDWLSESSSGFKVTRIGYYFHLKLAVTAGFLKTLPVEAFQIMDNIRTYCLASSTEFAASEVPCIGLEALEAR